MTIITNEHGQINVFAKEPQMYISEEDMQKYENQPYAEKAEMLNAKFALIGVISALVSYGLTGKLFFGVF
jgi:predicted anti-sigma-YlaC factor YlaD